MLCKPKPYVCLLLSLAFVLAIAGNGRAADKLMLDHAAIIVVADEPSFVKYGVEDLAGYLRDSTGTDISVNASPVAGQMVRIVVGKSATRQLAPHNIPDEQFGDEGYMLRSTTKDGMQLLAVTGATPRGTKVGLAALMKTIQVENRSAYVATPIDRMHKPSLAKRGMHFNGWAFKNPYSFRDWREEEWKRYLDVLAYQGVNLFYLWPFMEIMPVPLSSADQAYLEECRRVVDYAQQKHGMDVWIMQCTNRVAKDDCGVPDPRKRPYWRPSQEDLNPGNPEHFQAIMASREALYRILNNVDGVCNIDSDPGYYPGSTTSDYIKVLQGCRALLDRHNLHGKQTKLVNWMWEGWGLAPGQIATKGRDQHQLDTIATLKHDLPEPWGLVAGRGGDLALCKKSDTLDKTIFLPYGAIEGEPAYPGTNVQIDAIRKLFDTQVDKYPQLAGVMGNLQTPLLQFPNMYYFSSSMDDDEYRKRSEEDVLLDVSGHLYPDQRQLVADCFLALKDDDPSKVQGLADRLNEAVRDNKLGRPGLFARKLFPDSSIVAQSLVLQLNLRAARERLVTGAPTAAGTNDCQKLLGDYCDAYLAWDTAHGWHDLWGWSNWPLGMGAIDKQFATTIRSLSVRLGSRSNIRACLDGLSKQLSAKYEKAAVDAGCVALFERELLVNLPIETLAQKAKATASIAPDVKRYPPESAVDGSLATRYWPGALVEDNTEWLQLSWDKPQTFNKVVVRFLSHPSMAGRKIHLQRENGAGNWEDFATTSIATDVNAPYAVATFNLNETETKDKIRIVNLLDLFEVEVY